MGDPRDLRDSWEQLPTHRRRARERNAFKRFRARQITLQFSGRAVEAILNANWVAAVCSCLSAGNNSQGDLAVTGAARRKILEKHPPKPHKRNAERNRALIKGFREMKAANKSMTKSWFADLFADKEYEPGRKYPGAPGIRKILSSSE
jgi:hypothetical protein